MQDQPIIKTAIPRRRYQVGTHLATLLGEIESGDARQFRHLLAFVPQGQSEPTLYVCAQVSAPAERAEGAYSLVVVGEVISEVVDRDDCWGDLETFTTQALKLGQQALGLRQVQINRLL